MGGRTFDFDLDRAAALTADIDLRGRLRHYAQADRSSLDTRLAALDREWEIERVVEAQSALSGLAGVVLMAARGTSWMWLPVTVFGCMLQRATRGWSPMITLLNQRGYRLRTEIEDEKFGLRLLRGDFAGIPSATEAVPEVRAAANRRCTCRVSSSRSCPTSTASRLVCTPDTYWSNSSSSRG